MTPPRRGTTNWSSRTPRPEIVKFFLEYLYTDNLPAECPQAMWVPMLEIAVKYQVSCLSQLMAHKLLGGLTTDNAADLLAVATMYSVDSLADSVLEFISRNVEEVMKTEEFDKLLEEYPKLAKKIMLKMAPKMK
jgi:hypothetical protein